MTQNVRYQLVTFDVYTALFDIENSLAPSVSQVLHPDGLNFVRAGAANNLNSPSSAIPLDNRGSPLT